MHILYIEDTQIYVLLARWGRFELRYGRRADPIGQRLAKRLGHELFVASDGVASMIGMRPGQDAIGPTLEQGDRLAHDQARTLGLILTDLELPDGNSLSLIRTLHADLPGVPIVAVSSHAGATVEQAVPNAGGQAYLVKQGTLTQALLDVLRRFDAHSSVKSP